MIFKPSVPNNEYLWHTFNGDKYIKSLLTFQILCSNSQELLIEAFTKEDIVQLKNNTLPKVVIAFKDLFNRHDQTRKGKFLASHKNFKEL